MFTLGNKKGGGERRINNPACGRQACLTYPEWCYPKQLLSGCREILAWKAIRHRGWVRQG